MAKINNRGIYKNIDSPSLSDFLLGTKEEDGSTKSFPLQSVIQLINGVNGKNNIQYQFSDGSDPDIDYTTSGTFFTNNNSTSLPNFTELIFNKENLQPFDLSLLFNKIGVSEDIILKLEHPENPNIFFNLKVISFVDNTEYFVFGVQPFKDFYLGSLENEKIYSLYFDLQVISEEEKADKIIKSGNINISGLTISILENDFQWRINQQDFLNTPELINFPIPPAADGFYRSDILVGTSNNDYQLIQGTPDSSASVEPQAPINTIRIAGISLFGAIVGQPTPTPITNFVQKSERANVVLTGSGVINQLNLVDEKATIVFKGSITRLDTISYASVPYNGKRITLFNAQATPVTISHSVSGYGVDFVFADGQDYVLAPNQTIEFSFDITYAPYAHHMLIGAVVDSQIEVNSSRSVSNLWNGKTILFTANCIITVPATLLSQFGFVFRTLAGVTVTWAITAPFTWETAPSITPEKTTGSFMRRGNTNTILLDF